MINITRKQIEYCKKIYHKSNSSYKKIKIMCFLFKGKKLICKGINSDKTDPIQNYFGELQRKGHSQENFIDKRHAEIDCLKRFLNSKINLSNYTVFILSIRHDGTYRDSKPCPVCAKFLDSLKIGEICYIKENKFISEKRIYF